MVNNLGKKEEINETKHQFFVKINKIDARWARTTEEKKKSKRPNYQSGMKKGKSLQTYKKRKRL